MIESKTEKGEKKKMKVIELQTKQRLKKVSENGEDRNLVRNKKIT